MTFVLCQRHSLMILCLMPEASNVYSERNSDIPFDPAGVEQATGEILPVNVLSLRYKSMVNTNKIVKII